MGEDLLSRLHPGLLRFRVLEGFQVVIGSVHRPAGPYAKHGLIFIGPEEGDKDRSHRDQQDDPEAHHGDLVFAKPPHTVLKSGRGRPHLDHIFLFFFTCRQQVIHIHLHAQPFQIAVHVTSISRRPAQKPQCGMQDPYSSVIRGSTILYMMSLIRFMTTIRVASTIVVPMIII